MPYAFQQRPHGGGEDFTDQLNDLSYTASDDDEDFPANPLDAPHQRPSRIPQTQNIQQQQRHVSGPAVPQASFDLNAQFESAVQLRCADLNKVCQYIFILIYGTAG